jgi:hypothetical protein
LLGFFVEPASLLFRVFLGSTVSWFGGTITELSENPRAMAWSEVNTELTFARLSRTMM